MSVPTLIAVIPLPSTLLPCYASRMKKWFKEDFEWEIEVTGFLRGSDLRNIGGSGRYTKEIVYPDGCVVFRLTAQPVRTFHAV